MIKTQNGNKQNVHDLGIFNDKEQLSFIV